MSAPRISVILTVYKRTRYLLEALDSALAQTCRDFEVLVADDSGTRASAGLVASRGQQDRIRYLGHPRTFGVVASLRHACEQARGEFVTVLNDDDRWTPDFLERLSQPLIANPALVLAFSDHWVMDQGGQTDARRSDHWSSLCGRANLGGGPIINSPRHVVRHGVPFAITCMFRKDALDWELVSSRVGGAYDLWIPCVLAAKRRPFFYVPERLAHYRLHDEMATHDQSPHKGEDLVYIYGSLLERNWFPELTRALLTEHAYALFLAGSNKQRHSLTADARRYFWQCIRTYSPALQLRALAALCRTYLPRRSY